MIFLRNESLRDRNFDPTEGLILDLDFNGNYIDKSPAGLVLTGGNLEGTNPPTFIPGRKAGTFCANFDGSQSLRTTSNLPLNSDKVTVSFWMNTTHIVLSILLESDSNYRSVNGFAMLLNDIREGKIELGSGTSSVRKFVDSNNNVNSGVWFHIIGVIDRSITPTLVKIYVNGIDVTTLTHVNSNNTGLFPSVIFFIGQRGGKSLGFNGQLQNLQVRNIALTDEQALQLYNSQL